MKLTDLSPKFLVAESPTVSRHTDSIIEAQGVMFLCPECFSANGEKSAGVHRVTCWSRTRGTPDDRVPGPGRWALEGTGYADLTLAAEVSDANPEGKRSVQLTSGCMAHFHVTNGEVTFA